MNSNTVISMPSQLFTMRSSFKAAANGSVYIGEVDTDPTIPTNQIQVYIEQENGTLVPVAQPIKINSAGLLTASGQVQKFVLTNTEYSMTVQNSYGVDEFYFPRVYDQGISAALEVEERLLGPGAKIYRGSNGQYVRVGDVVPGENPPYTHLAVPINGKTEDVTMSPILSGVVDSLTYFGAIIGSTATNFYSATSRSFTTIQEMLIAPTIIGGRYYVGDTVWLKISEDSGDITDFKFISGEWTISPTGIAEVDTPLLKMVFSVENATIKFKDGVPFIFDNSDGSTISFQNGSTYLARKNGFINPTDGSQSFISTIGKSGFNIKGLRSYGATEAMDISQGNRLWYFEECFDFEMDKYEASRSGWDGIFFRRCHGFSATKGKTDYNKSSGHLFEDCYDYEYKPRTSSKNGRNSSDDSYADLPPSWTGGHVGRGFTIYSTGVNRDQRNSEVVGGRFIENTEFNMRVFAQGPSNPGVQNLTLRDFYAENGGHPAGAYGVVVVAADKGADVLINTSTSDESSGITVRDYTVKRTLAFGQPVSIAGDDNESINGTVRCLGSASGVVDGYTLFEFKNGRMNKNKSYSARRHVVIATNTANVELISERGYSCRAFMQGFPGGDRNLIHDNYARHVSVLAVTGENGLSVSGNASIKRNRFDGFHRGVEHNSGTVMYEGNETKNSVDIGFRNFNVNSPTVKQKDNDWDSQNPFFKSAVVYESTTPRSGGISMAHTIPTEGYYARGHLLIDTQPDAEANGRRLFGWYRLVAGSGHVVGTDWQELWINTSSL